MQVLIKLLTFIAEYGDALIAVTELGKAEFCALICSLVEIWCEEHNEDAVKFIEDIAQVIKKHKGLNGEN